MKKLITIIMILATLLPAAALAIDRDIIVGYWYMFIDGDFYPEFMANFGDYDYILSAYFFAEDGTIYLLEADMKDGSASPAFVSCGKWKKVKGIRTYSYKIMGLGEGTLKVEEGGDMYLGIPGSDSASMHLRKISPFSPYTDYKY